MDTGYRLGGLTTDHDGPPGTAFRVKRVPHEWLFEWVKATLHHGGIGIMSVALRAGIPTTVVRSSLVKNYQRSTQYSSAIHRRMLS